ncbi:hypothetical protein ZIOFF_020467 [Zingiber officinale]|uniref:Uncharacterized protein n=1 Tax=Zingiber officinale TaxID=94328 RepID=A0A8J5H7T3_ZINOF|nr:hypothetical protein ZIOFF_020467 [Zingiber officinale]
MQLVLQQFDNDLSDKLSDAMNEIRQQRCSYLRLRLCKKGDPSGWFKFKVACILCHIWSRTKRLEVSLMLSSLYMFTGKFKPKWLDPQMYASVTDFVLYPLFDFVELAMTRVDEIRKAADTFLHVLGAAVADYPFINQIAITGVFCNFYNY